jgi:hypothetical protein
MIWVTIALLARTGALAMTGWVLYLLLRARAATTSRVLGRMMLVFSSLGVLILWVWISYGLLLFKHPDGIYIVHLAEEFISIPWGVLALSLFLLARSVVRHE